MTKKLNQMESNSANWLMDGECHNQIVDRNRLNELELELKYEQRASAELFKENTELKKKVERLTTENRMLHREVGKKEGIQEILQQNFSDANVRAQQLEREVGQLLGELSNEQSKLEDVNQQNTELRAELEQFRGNLTAFDDPKKQSSASNQNYFVFAAENELEQEQKVVADVAPNAEFELEHQNYMELEMDDAIGDTSDHDHNFTQSTTPQRVHRKTYFEVARFEDTQSWRQWMSEPEQQTWAKHQVCNSKGSVHQFEYLQCRYRRHNFKHCKDGAPCYAMLKVVTHKETGEVTVLQSLEHIDHGTKKWGLSAREKEIIKEKMRQHKSPAQIYDSLQREHKSKLERRQVVNFIAQEKRRSILNAAQHRQMPNRA